MTLSRQIQRAEARRAAKEAGPKYPKADARKVRPVAEKPGRYSVGHRNGERECARRIRQMEAAL